MRVVIQRVRSASVIIQDKVFGEINCGIVVFVGFELHDNEDDVKWMVNKIINMRIFNDINNKMNLSLLDIDGEILLISQFTLYSSTRKGNRPSFSSAAKPAYAKKYYEITINEIQKKINNKIQKGKFGSMMDVSLINDGPVTITMDSKNKE